MVGSPALDDPEVLVGLGPIVEIRVGSVEAELVGLDLAGLEAVVEGPPEVGDRRKCSHPTQDLK